MFFFQRLPYCLVLGGYVFPQRFGGSCDESAVGFTLFLTETWWAEADGGLLELFDEQAVPTKVLPQGWGLVLVAAIKK